MSELVEKILVTCRRLEIRGKRRRDDSTYGTVFDDIVKGFAGSVDRVSASFQQSPQGRDTMAKRERIEPHPGDKRYVRRDDKGRFTDHGR